MNSVDQNRFTGQVAIVAGGARGIGRGIAARLLAEGAIVYIWDVNQDHINQCRESLSSYKARLRTEVVDITDESVVHEGINKVISEDGKIDIMVNCAGIVGQTNVPIDQYDTTIFQRVLDVNITGPFLLTKYVIPHMTQRKYGRILHIASIGGKEGNPGMVGYAASKSGLMGLIKGAGKEFAESGITVNGIAPAVIATEFNENTDPAMLKYMTDKIPMKRMGTIEETAALACWIVSDEASFNTGCIFDLSGGRATY